jgi:hypothetical protein
MSTNPNPTLVENLLRPDVVIKYRKKWNLILEDFYFYFNEIYNRYRAYPTLSSKDLQKVHKEDFGRILPSSIIKNFSSSGKVFHQEDFLFCLAVQAFECIWYNKAQQNARLSKGKTIKREEDPQSHEQTTTEHQLEPSQSDMEVKPTFQQVSTLPPSKNSKKKKAKKQRTAGLSPPNNSGKTIT